MILILRFVEGIRCEGCGAVNRWCEVRWRLCLVCSGQRVTLQTRKMRPEPPAPWRAALKDLGKKLKEFRAKDMGKNFRHGEGRAQNDG